MATTYSFRDVLVADTKLLITGRESDDNLATHRRQQPNLLVLNNRLNKCSSARPNCATCCLRLEEPEFRRRSGSVLAVEQQCFAQCSQRRSLNIELVANAKLSGKIVILALSKVDLSGEPLRCHTTTSWSYVRFVPPSTSQVEVREMKQSESHFAKLSRSQMPPILIESAQLSRDHLERKESLSLLLHSKSGKRKHQEVVETKETLSVLEMSCFATSDNLRPTGKLHLLALMNRNVSSPTVQPQSNFTTTTTTTTLPVIDKGRRALTSVAEAAAAAATHEIGANQLATSTITSMIDQRIDLPAVYVNPLLSSTTTLSDLSPHNNNNNNNNIDNPIDNQQFRMRLKSNSLMVLTMSSSLVIFTYTLCLLIYLKTRHKQCKQTPTTIPSTNHQNTAAQQMQISQPFNLQMPPETRTRLQQMMLIVNDDDVDETNKTNINKSTTHANESRSLPQCCSQNKHIYDHHQYQTANNHHQAAYGTLNFVRAIRQATATLTKRTGMMRHQLQLQQQQQYKPNLNVIPESELEYLQSTPRAEVELSLTPKSFLNQTQANPSGYHHHHHHLQKSTSMITSESHRLAQVQDAMQSECSHVTGRFHHSNHRHHRRHQNQTTATLFAKPTVIHEDGNVAINVVSRSRILNQVKEDSYDCNDYGRLVDTRM